MVERNSDRKKITGEKYAYKDLSTMLNDQTIELNFVRNKLENFEGTILRDVQKRISGMIEEVMQELRKYRLQTNEFHNFATPQILHQNNNSNIWNNRIITTNDTLKAAVSTQERDTIEEDKAKLTNNKTTNDLSEAKLMQNTQSNKPRELKKIFIMRESFLTALLEVDHMKTIYHIFYIIVLIFLLNNLSQEYFVKGSITFGLSVFKTGFENIHKVVGIWILQHVFVFSIHCCLRIWSHVRTKLNTHQNLQRLWSISCLLVYISTQLIFAYVPTKICLYLNLPFVTASVLLLETVRLLMKMHSFVRTTVPRILAGKIKAEQVSGQSITVAPFGKYLYYLFAPTLLYRDEYPRTSTIRWKFALSRLSEIVAVAFLYNYIYEQQIKHYFGNFGLEEIDGASMTIKIFGMLMPSMIIFLTGFYMILHSWLNFTAELLRFGDRMFYRDWWTASNYEAYYRNWNVVVHDWLYEYIYKEIYNHVFKHSKFLSSLSVFIVSALFHEYILSYALQIFFPVMFFFFGVVGIGLIFLTRYIPKNLGNFLIWLSLIYGNGFMVCLYSMEYFTRINCPKNFNSWTDYLVPHVWSRYFK